MSDEKVREKPVFHASLKHERPGFTVDLDNDPMDSKDDVFRALKRQEDSASTFEDPEDTGSTAEEPPYPLPLDTKPDESKIRQLSSESAKRTLRSFATLWDGMGLTDKTVDGVYNVTLKPGTGGYRAFTPTEPSDSEETQDEEAQDKELILLKDALSMTDPGFAETLGADASKYTLGLGREAQVSEQDEVNALEPLSLPPSDKQNGDLELLEVIGQGGMGIVWLARQLSLKRKVAAKSLREDKKTPKAQRSLLREAWLAGMLEHPSIIPIYTINYDTADQMQIVMKQIEGIEWETFLREPEKIKRMGEVRDHLEWHLRILMRVCDAVHYAHSKGIVHRDLKPENVMIGEFGEVYVLDWGIAASLLEEHKGYLPLIKETMHLCGTPSYMAPELVSVEVKKMGVRTDVYLLGSILHQILVGEPPHTGDSLYNVIYDAYKSKPKNYDREVPKELAAICKKAMSRKPPERYESVELFRQAIAGFLRHRHSNTLVKEANHSLDQMKELIQEKGEVSIQQKLYSLFTQCRFAFQQALKIWPENEEAKEGLQSALEEMITYELEDNNVNVARLHLLDLPEPNPELEKKIKQLEQMDRMGVMDDTSSRRVRSIITFWIGTIWCFVPIIYYNMVTSGIVEELTHTAYIITTFPFILFMGWLIFMMRSTMLRTKLNRHVIRILIILSIALFLSRIGGTWMGLALRQIVTLDMLVATLVVSAIAVAVELSLAGSAVIYGIGFLVSSLHTDLAYYCIGFSNFGALSYMAFIWKPEKEDRLEDNPA